MILAKYPANMMKSLADKLSLYFLDRTKNTKSHSLGVKEIFVWTRCTHNVYGAERAWMFTDQRLFYILCTHDHTFLKIYIKNHRIANHCLHDVTTRLRFHRSRKICSTPHFESSIRAYKNLHLCKNNKWIKILCRNNVCAHYFRKITR